MSDFSTAGIVRRQATEPIYMTNGCLEVAHASPEVFEALGLRGAYLYWNQQAGRTEDGPVDGDHWYPLTREENEFVAEDMTEGPFGGLITAYTLLYKGRKWFAPSVEVCHIEGRVFSRESYGGSLYETRDEALAAANRFADAIRPSAEKLGGEVYVDPDTGDDRHTVNLLFPTDVVVATFKDYDEWKQHLNSLLRPYNDLK
jgi:hypothetical protein